MRPLDGIRILDLSRLLPGPMCCWYLRGMGAEVVKLESPEGGDPLRHMPPLNADGAGLWFHALNSGARSVALDLKSSDGLDAAKALIKSVDVVIEGFRPGVMARLGLNPAELIEEHPALIVVSITGYGQTGTWKHRPGHDLGYMGLSGMLSMNAGPDQVPQPLSVQVADVGGGALTGAMAVLGALLERERTGKGQWVDVSMTEGAMAFGLPWLAAAQFEGKSPNSAEHPLGGSLPQYRCYRCQDGQVITVAALEPKFLMDLCTRLGTAIPESAAAWEDLFATRSAAQWLQLLEGCCVAPALKMHEVVEHPLHREREAVQDTPYGFSVVPPVGSARQFLNEPAPQLGADTIRELAQVGIEWDDSE